MSRLAGMSVSRAVASVPPENTKNCCYLFHSSFHSSRSQTVTCYWLCTYKFEVVINIYYFLVFVNMNIIIFLHE